MCDDVIHPLIGLKEKYRGESLCKRRGTPEISFFHFGLPCNICTWLGVGREVRNHPVEMRLNPEPKPSLTHSFQIRPSMYLEIQSSVLVYMRQMKDKGAVYHATAQKIFLEYSRTISSCRSSTGGGKASGEENELTTIY